jgi:hypothetical protein
MRSLTLSQWSDLTTGDNYVIRLRSSSDSASESILDELEAIDLGLVKIVVERVTVVKFRMDYGTGPNLVQKSRSTSFPSSPSLPCPPLPFPSPFHPLLEVWGRSPHPFPRGSGRSAPGQILLSLLAVYALWCVLENFGDNLLTFDLSVWLAKLKQIH